MYNTNSTLICERVITKPSLILFLIFFNIDFTNEYIFIEDVSN